MLEEDFFKRMYPSEKTIVVMSDTGNEHPHILEHVQFISAYCKEKGIEFYFLTPDMGFHSEAWSSLDHQYDKNQRVGSAAFPQTCTDNLKVKPIDRFIAHYIRTWYPLPIKPGSQNASVFKAFARKYGNLNLMIGFGADEGHRVKNAKDLRYDPKWKIDSINRIYPLMELRIGRIEVQNYIKSKNLNLPYPSNCMKCFYMSLQELLWLWSNFPNVFIDWERQEQNKLNNPKDAGRVAEGKPIYGVFGRKTLREKLNQAIAKFGQMSDVELNEYKMSHGHCVKSKY